MLFLVRAKKRRFDENYLPVDLIESTDSKAAMEEANRRHSFSPSLKVNLLTNEVRSQLNERALLSVRAARAAWPSAEDRTCVRCRFFQGGGKQICFPPPIIISCDKTSSVNSGI